MNGESTTGNGINENNLGHPRFQDIKFSLVNQSGRGKGSISVLLNGIGPGPLYPNKSDITSNNLKVNKTIVIKVKGQTVLTIPVEYIPKR